MAKLSFHIGRILLGFVLIALGYYTFTNGHQAYNKYLHAIRKLVLPDSQASSTIASLGITFEQLNQQIVKVLGGLFALSGACTVVGIMGLRKTGAVLMIIAVAFVLVTRDNFLLQTGGSKTQSQPMLNRVCEFLKHLFLIGAALLVYTNGGSYLKKAKKARKYSDDKDE